VTGREGSLAGAVADVVQGSVSVDVRDARRHELFEEELTRLNGRPSVTIQSKTVRAAGFGYSEIPLAQTLERLVKEGKSPVYVVHFTQLEAAQSAQDFTSINVCTREEKAVLGTALEGFKFSSPYGPISGAGSKHGIGLHHAGYWPSIGF